MALGLGLASGHNAAALVRLSGSRADAWGSLRASPPQPSFALSKSPSNPHGSGAVLRYRAFSGKG